MGAIVAAVGILVLRRIRRRLGSLECGIPVLNRMTSDSVSRLLGLELIESI